MSLALASQDSSTTKVSAYLAPSVATKSGMASRIVYTLSLCTAVSSIVAFVDMFSVALLGEGMPWIFLPALLAFYLLGGALLGGLLLLTWKIVAQRRHAPISQSNFSNYMQRTVYGLLVASFVIVTLERLISGHAGYSDLSANSHLALLAIGFLVAFYVIVLLVSSRGMRADANEVSIGQITVLAVSFVWWAPFNKLYDAPMMSATSMLWNGFYLVISLTCYGALSFFTRHGTPRLSLGNTNSCLRVTCLFAITSLALSSTTWAFNHPSPIDRMLPSQPSNNVATASNTKPNVVLIVMDTTRADHLSCYGYSINTTPNLSALAKESVVYKHVITPAPWTLPAHASLFTGLYPRQHEAYCHPRDESVCEVYPLPPEKQTLAELLSSHGYDTAAVLGNWSILHRSFKLDQGFSYYDDRPRLAINSTIPNTLSPARWLSGIGQLFQGKSGSSRSAVEVNASAITWLERSRHQPFFLFINYLDPHQPYQAHPEFESQLLSTSAHQHDAVKIATPLSPIRPKLEDDIARYDQELAFVDAQIGQLFDELRSAGVYDSSLIIITSDHGEAFDEHGYLGHSNTVYEEEVHVPLIVRYPHSTRQGVVNKMTSLVSVAHLITEAIDVPPLDHDTSKPNDEPDIVFTERFRWLPKTNHLYGPTASAVYLDDGVKVILYEGAKIKTRAYDLIADPFERFEIAAQRPDHVARANALWQAWFDKLRYRRISGSGGERNTQLTEKLKTLGYIGD